ncbi:MULTISPECIES: leucine-rich repeat domain-containing protein [unclassified Pseudomonas]|uniref:leucine-rich repeat domain-containing protein n=1 Tax=unclassified Pseudomonas TaxID=196821 RepID=UPI000A09F72E|nr:MULTISPECIES: leucine-rich repeat domain-containing protein [unclassified Pseudomonas]SMF30557.1 Leucine-rich repeat (LRR) protein [Pseudomonas sp. LAIL14HWK12:I11]SMR78174.1 Leucine-rich repeat (LRR) protein [Pseudomonas sp. LAIL14HWK12:I10]SOD04472.1 Leucine-rich repeat (LRR) protein [Pseudomonas sp. LAIL14HWK12:I8]
MPSPQPQPYAVDTLIASRLPAWLASASEDHLGKLRVSLQRQQRSQHRLAELFSRVTPLDAFAKTLLDQALSDRQLPALDVRQVKLRTTTTLPIASVGPGGLGNSVSEIAEVSLLTAALHNFSEHETPPSGAFQTHVIVDAQGEPQSLSPQAYVALCRSVDVGGRYQHHLESILLGPGEKSKRVEALLEDSARANLEADVRLAVLKGEIDERVYLQFLPVLSTVAVVDSDTTRLLPFDLRVLGKQLRGVLAFEARRGGLTSAPLEGVVLWVPDDPHGPLQRFATWDELWHGLGRRCQAKGYPAFIQRFIGERDRCAFSRTLRRLLQARAGALPVQLDGRSQAIDRPLFPHLRKVRLDTLLDDARVLATPTAEADQAERERRMGDYASAGFDLLGLASLFVPVLGLPLLGIAALQIADEVYEGYADWKLGDREGALNHLWGVAENVIAGVAVASIGLVAGRLIERSAYVDALVPVLKAHDEVRLIDAELPGYAVPQVGLAVGERTRVAGQTRLRTHLATYQVAEDAQGAGLRIQHPSRPSAYSPLIDSNGEGGWCHQLETPQHWQGATQLMQRLNSAWAALDPLTAERVMHTTGFDEARLRRLHLEHAPAPARLHDALQRYQLHAQYPELHGDAFELHLSGLQRPLEAAEQLLKRDFPGLTPRAARQITQRAGPEEVERMIGTQRVPLALASEARWLLRDSRLDRACAGFYQAAAVNADTERLAFGLLADAAPWAQSVRVELRNESLSGDLLAHVGAEGAADVRYVIRRGQGYQASPAASENGTLFQALWWHLDEAQKQVLGEGGQTGEQLGHALAVRAGEQRERAATLLGMAPKEGVVRPPVRFGDGRLGYPLSGGDALRLPRGQVLTTADMQARQSIRAGLHQLFPHRPAQDVMWLALQLAQRPGRTVWTAFSELARQVERLDVSLRAWRGQATAVNYHRRQRVGQMIREAWEPDFYGPGGVDELIVRNEPVGNLPVLPADLHFGHLHRLSLSNVGMSALEGDFLGRFPQLRSLQLSGNRLMALPGLGNLRRLVSLDVQHNRLTTLEGVQHLSSLTQLIANDNALTEVPGLATLTRLTRLDLRGNQLAVLDGVQGLTLLTQLDLSDNLLSALPEQIHRLIRLQYLNLSNNQFTSLPAGIERMVGLTQLNLSGNRLGELPDTLRALTRLLQLHLAENRLRSVPAVIGTMPSLRILNLRGNQLEVIPEGLERLRQLTELYLADNQIVIDVAGGQRLEAFSELRTFSLKGNPIGMIPPLRNLDHLRHLSLRATGLSEFPLAFLERHTQVYVDLADNLIVELSERALAWIRQYPNRLNLNNNPLDEQDLARWRAVWAQFDTLSQRG